MNHARFDTFQGLASSWAQSELEQAGDFHSIESANSFAIADKPGAMHGSRLPNPRLSAFICGSQGLEQQRECLRHERQENMTISLREAGRLRPGRDQRTARDILWMLVRERGWSPMEKTTFAFWSDFSIDSSQSDTHLFSILKAGKKGDRQIGVTNRSSREGFPSALTSAGEGTKTLAAASVLLRHLECGACVFKPQAL